MNFWLEHGENIKDWALAVFTIAIGVALGFIIVSIYLEMADWIGG